MQQKTLFAGHESFSVCQLRSAVRDRSHDMAPPHRVVGMLTQVWRLLSGQSINVLRRLHCGPVTTTAAGCCCTRSGPERATTRCARSSCNSYVPCTKKHSNNPYLNVFAAAYVTVITQWGQGAAGLVALPSTCQCDAVQCCIGSQSAIMSATHNNLQ